MATIGSVAAPVRAVPSYSTMFYVTVDSVQSVSIVPLVASTLQAAASCQSTVTGLVSATYFEHVCRHLLLVGRQHAALAKEV